MASPRVGSRKGQNRFGKRGCTSVRADACYDDGAATCGLRVASEGFADRAYDPDGSLASRTRAGSVIHDPVEVVQRSIRMVTEGRVTATDGSELSFRVDTLCTHGDTPGAHELTRRLRAGLEQQGIAVRALGERVAPA